MLSDHPRISSCALPDDFREREDRPDRPLENIALALETRIQEISAKLQEIGKRRCLALGCPEVGEKLTLLWNPRMRTVAGRAFPFQFKIVLNPKLLDYPIQETWRTFLHELAHLIAVYRGGRQRIAPHGIEWQLACIELGIPDETRCHRLPLEGRKMKRRYFYRCVNCRNEIGRTRPLNTQVACSICCDKFNGGHYHPAFYFVEIQKSSEEGG